MADFSRLTASITTLKGNSEALIAKVGVEDPAIQAGINAAQASVDAINTEVLTKLP